MTDLTKELLRVIAKEEGCALKAYADKKHPNYSIGFGHKIKSYEFRDGIKIKSTGETVPILNPPTMTTITKQQALGLLLDDVLSDYLPRTISGVTRDIWETLGDAQKIALVSYTYNRGSLSSPNYEPFKSEMRLYLESKNYKNAANLIRRYGKLATGILKPRRDREAFMIENNTLHPYYNGAAYVDTGNFKIDESKTSNISESRPSPCGVYENMTEYTIDFDSKNYKNIPTWVLIEINGTFGTRYAFHYFKNSG